MEDKTNVENQESGLEDQSLEKTDEVLAQKPKKDSQTLKVSQEAKPEASCSKFRSPDGAYLIKRGEKIDHSPIKKDFEAAEIIDYANDHRDQQVVFTCEHSSNK